MIKRIVIVAALAAIAPMAGAQQRGRIVVQSVQPAGWLGITTRELTPGTRDGAKGARRPMIVSVTPGSPAQQAGLAAGDTIVSYNDTDVLKEPRALERMLRPGNRVLVRVWRSGVQDIPVTVGERPDQNDISVSYGSVNIEFNGALDGVSNSEPLGRLTTVPMRGFIISPTVCGEDMAVAGAAVVRLTVDLADALRVSGGGVFVTGVAPGTPAKAAGLRSGDVIISADTMRVQDPTAIVKIMQLKSARAASGATERAVLLDVRRKGKARKVALRW